MTVVTANWRGRNGKRVAVNVGSRLALGHERKGLRDFSAGVALAHVRFQACPRGVTLARVFTLAGRGCSLGDVAAVGILHC